MEIVFLIVLIALMVSALTSGYPVAFALPGSAILAIALAAFSGYLIEGDPSAYFAQDGPSQWLSAGVTNFRSLYWDVERDTLIAVPLFIFMGIMLQRSKIAEDLLVAMARLFGPIPGGLGISVVFVGALLAATTGIVGATVIAMGLISLPAMLRHNYSKPLAAGTICAAGTLGQIIPPSIVLIILADQLGAASDQASTARKALYKVATGEFSMPAPLDVTSASAGDMFMGALLPGFVLVGLYMAYILITALLRPGSAPPVPYEGKYDGRFFLGVILALVPPLALIFAVLGSIVLGVATVNQAGAIGAVGAMVMGSYRLAEGKPRAYVPAIIAIVSTAGIMLVLHFFDINVKNIKGSRDMLGVALAAVAVSGLLVGVLWSTWRAYRTDDTLSGVMAETAKTTSMVFIILLGAAMLTAAFRGFGGETLVRAYLTSLPGGFWSQFIVVMAVIFLLGFFIDFIEIAVVVVPIVAPILLTEPEANVTAIWLGVMVGLNMQTSFLTPPFGFSLFYLRGVAPPSVRTVQIYRGAVAFILLQLAGLAIAGVFPSLVNYLPDRIYLSGATAPPPVNPRLQACIERYVFEYYDVHGDDLRRDIAEARGLDISYVPERRRKALEQSYADALATFGLANRVRAAQAALADFSPRYRPLHREVRRLQAAARDLDVRIGERDKDRIRTQRSDQVDTELIQSLVYQIAALKQKKKALLGAVPEEWDSAHARYLELAKALDKARGAYRRNVDGAYEAVAGTRKVIAATAALSALRDRLDGLESRITHAPADEAMGAITALEKAFAAVEGASAIKSRLSKARRALKGDQPKRRKAARLLDEGRALFEADLAWRQRASRELEPGLAAYDRALSGSIGLRLQKRLDSRQADQVARCQSKHRDVSLNF